jgi:ABC-type multidrug transport system ATPase subunit/ABC-type multidrug transport system permease subunit
MFQSSYVIVALLIATSAVSARFTVAPDPPTAEEQDTANMASWERNVDRITQRFAEEPYVMPTRDDRPVVGSQVFDMGTHADVVRRNRKASAVAVTANTLKVLDGPAVINMSTDLALGALGATQCHYPCHMQHGCVCNTSNRQKYSFFGTCEQCDQGWGGENCGALVMSCVNGGVKVALPGAKTSTCVCPKGWRGPSCEYKECERCAKNGGKKCEPDMKNLCNDCSKGWAGLNCNMCTANSVCPAGKVCNTSIIAKGHQKSLYCELTNEHFLKLLVLPSHPDQWPITAFFKFDCTKPTLFNNTQKSDGVCTASLHRLQRNASLMDPFFWCSLRDCGMVVERREIPVVYAKQSHDTHVVRAAMRWVMYAMCFIYVLLGVFGGFRVVRRMRNVCVVPVGVILSATLIIYLLYSSLYGRKVLHAAYWTEFATYKCAHTKCVCARDPPPPYMPNCATSISGKQFLPNIYGITEIACNIATNECKFTTEFITTFTLSMKCNASSCDDKGDTASVSSGRAAFSAPPPVGTSDFSVAGGIGLLTLAATLGAVGHFIFVMQRTYRLKKQFNAEYRGFMHTNVDTGLKMKLSLKKACYSVVREVPLAFRVPFVRAREGRLVFDFINVGGGQKEHRLTEPELGPEPLLRDSIALPYTANGSLTGSQGYLQPEHSNTRNSFVETANTWSRESEEERKKPIKKILHDVSFTISSGEALAIIGSSGAGKTTLLDLIAKNAKDGASSGVMRINGTRVTKSNKWVYKRMTGFVAQEDVLVPALTVQQTIRHAAKLKLPAAFPDDFIDSLVTMILKIMHLTTCANTAVGGGTAMGGARGISGGERRRVSIAMELIANPRVLLLDEPTSGLDSVNAFRVMRAVVNLSKALPDSEYNRFFSHRPIVIFSIHQPSIDIFNLFDKMLVLNSGIVSYFGPAKDAVPHTSSMMGLHSAGLAHRNPAEVLLEMLSDATDDQMKTVRANAQHGLGVAGRHTPMVGENGRPWSDDIEDDAVEDRAELADTLPTPAENETASAPLLLNAAAAPDAAAVSDDEQVAVAVERPRRENVMKATADNLKYYPNAWQQFFVLSHRTADSLLGSFYLMSAHAAATVFLALVFSYLYPHEKLSLDGTIDKAGMLTFLLLIVSFSSLSVLDLFIAERRLFACERDNGYYSSLPYFAAKVLFDFIPLRIIPVGVLAACIYFPMGLRDDTGTPFLWFVLVIVLFSMCMCGLCLCVGMVVPSFGAGALFCSLLILWCSVFGGLLIETNTIPSYFLFFAYSSPFHLAFEALMINDLNGRPCLFAPDNSHGRPDNAPIPLQCVQYLYNFGLKPDNFHRDVALLAVGVVGTLVLACFLLIVFVKHKR